MPFQIQVIDSKNEELYTNHSEYHQGDAGLDLFVVEDFVIPAHEMKLVGLGIKCQLLEWSWCPVKWFKQYKSYFIFPRSSISKTPLRLANSIGLIDSAYNGELKIALHNTSDRPYEIKRGQRLVQLVKPDLSPISFTVVNELRSTTRGSGGFGSTGV